MYLFVLKKKKLQTPVEMIFQIVIHFHWLFCNTINIVFEEVL